MIRDPQMVRANLIGIGFMTLSMAGFAVEDGLIKAMSERISTGQILIVIGGVGTIVLAAVTWLQGYRFYKSQLMHPTVLARTLAELIGTSGIVAALAFVDVSVISAIIQANPLLVTMGAALFLKEAVGPRRWTAIGIGLLGVLIILRPFGAGMELGYLWAVIGVIGLSARDVLTRKVPKEIPTQIMATMGFASVIFAGFLLFAFDPRWTPMDRDLSIWLGGTTGVGLLAYTSLIVATRIGEISAIMPFRYSRLIFGALVGVFVFQETIDLWTALGALLIVVTGLYSFWREMKAG
ncbi:MAG: DMT family transporter [Planktomarina sp.]